MAQATIQTRLCPDCANSIAADALVCPYCKADLVTASEPQWPEHEDVQRLSGAADKPKLTVRSKAILVFGLLVFALGVYLVGRDVKRHDLDEILATHQEALREKDRKIQTLQAELAAVRQKLQSDSEAATARAQESQRNLAALQRKLAGANKEVERLSKQAAAVRPAVRPADAPAARPSSARPSTGVQPRTYEAVRSTQVYAEPLGSARVVARLTKGTQITVVGSENGWLEIRSNHGKPPGFIRADDAIFISRAN